MGDEMEERRSGMRLEQHVGTILQIMVVALLGWSLTATQNMSQDVAVLKVKVESLQTSITQGTNDRYRADDARRDFASVRQEIQHIEKRIYDLEMKRK
jgi:uncharacterized protein YaaN involved in tellurite resistance